jgi:Flp pilus assembly protein TadD
LNLAFVALRTLRGGSVIASDGVLRQALELACVAFQIANDASGATLKKFVGGKLDAPKSISHAKAVYAPIGRLYGVLSSSAVHGSLEHIHHSVSSEPSATGTSGRIRIGASFDPAKGKQFKLGIVRIERVAIAMSALVEAIFFDRVEGRLWKKTPKGLEWSDDPEIDLRLRQADSDEESIRNPFLTVYSWADSQDRLEVEQFLGTTRGPALADIARLAQLSSEHPASFILHYLLGFALEEEGNLGGSTVEFETAWELRPDGYDVWNHLERIYQRESDHKPLEDFYKRTLIRDPKDYVATHNIGMLYARLDRHNEALQRFDEAHALRPDRYAALYNSGKALSRLERYSEAVGRFERSAELRPADPDPWHNAGVAHVHNGDLPSAYRAFRKAVQRDSGYLASWLNLTSICAELGMPRRARMCAKRAQQLAAGDRRIKEILDYLTSRVEKKMRS